MKIINNELIIREKRIKKYNDKIKELEFIKDYIIKNSYYGNDKNKRRANLNNDDFMIDNYDLTLCICTDENYYFINNLFHEEWLKKHCIILHESDKDVIIEGLKEIKIDKIRQ